MMYFTCVVILTIFVGHHVCSEGVSYLKFKISHNKLIIS